MKLRRIILILITAAAGLLPLMGSGCSDTGTETATYQNVTPSEANDLIQENVGNGSFVILDVRTPSEYASGHLSDAINIDVESGHFENDIESLEKDKTYLVYCRSGRRSADASEIMIQQGFTDVYNMTSGINEWISEGYPVTQ